VGNLTSIGLMPGSQRNLFGVRYRLLPFEATHFATGNRFGQTFHRVEVSGRFRVWRRLQAFGLVAGVYQTRTNYPDPYQAWGLVEPIAGLLYTVVNTADSSRHVRHIVQAGGGIKVALPRSDQTVGSEGTATAIQTAQLQLITGTWDALLNASWRASAGRWGWQFDGTTRLNTPNNEGYRFGHQFAGNAYAFRLFQVFSSGGERRAILQPLAGLTAEYETRDQYRNFTHRTTGGHALFATAGIDVFGKNWGASLRGQIPVLQHRMNGQLITRAQASLQVFRMF
jgi:hypothetical protein